MTQSDASARPAPRYRITTYRNPKLPDLGNRPWIGADFDRQPHRLLMLGESYNEPAAGRYDPPEHEHDEVYMRELILTNRLTDKFFENVPAYLSRTRDAFWHEVMFTNLVIGQLPYGARPTRDDFDDGAERLAQLLSRYRIDGVLSLGKKQAPYAQAACKRLGVAFAAVNHPSGQNNRMGPASRCTPERMQEAWTALHSQFAARANNNEAMGT